MNAVYHIYDWANGNSYGYFDVLADALEELGSLIYSLPQPQHLELYDTRLNRSLYKTPPNGEVFLHLL